MSTKEKQRDTSSLEDIQILDNYSVTDDLVDNLSLSNDKGSGRVHTQAANNNLVSCPLPLHGHVGGVEFCKIRYDVNAITDSSTTLFIRERATDLTQTAQFIEQFVSLSHLLVNCVIHHK